MINNGMGLFGEEKFGGEGGMKIGCDFNGEGQGG